MECAERGLSKTATARKLFLSLPTVSKYAKLYSIDFSAKPSSLDLTEVRAAAAEGLTRKQAVERFGVCYSTIHRLANEYGIHFPRSGTGPADAERATAMEAMYRGGKTLAEIGTLYGVTRERVRQILSRHQRMTADEGGQAFKARINREKSRVKKEALCQERYGCSLAERRMLLRIGREMVKDGCGRYRTPTYAFTSQRSNAKARGIDWSMTLLDWWRVWEASGKWAERGRGQGFMMCRFGDAGAYEIGNVYIATGVHNGTVQPNNPYRKGHPRHAEVMQARAA